MSLKVAIILPTKNRTLFLLRQIEYYILTESIHPLYIGDSSKGSERKIFKNKINKLKANFDINYFEYPDLNGHEVIKNLMQKIKEDYCVYIGDDDFLVPKSLSKCAGFLRINNDYRTAQGRAFLFSLDDKNLIKGNINHFYDYWQKPNIANQNAKDRVTILSKNYWVSQFSVHRTLEFLEDSKDYFNNRDGNFSELIHCFNFIGNGKSKFINCLYLIRQTHDYVYKELRRDKWISSPLWKESFEIFVNSISKLLIKNDNLGLKESRKIAINSFWAWYNRENTFKIFLRVTNLFKKIIINFFPKKYYLFLKLFLKKNGIIKSGKIHDYDQLFNKKLIYYDDFNVFINFIRKK